MSFLPGGSLTRGRLERRFAVSVVMIGAPRATVEIAALSDRLRAPLEADDAEILACDVGGLVHPDVATVEALARLHLAAGRLGCRLRLDGGSAELHWLLALAGLCEVVGCGE